MLSLPVNGHSNTPAHHMVLSLQHVCIHELTFIYWHNGCMQTAALNDDSSMVGQGGCFLMCYTDSPADVSRVTVTETKGEITTGGGGE